MSLPTPPNHPPDETPLPADRPFGVANDAVTLYKGPIETDEFGARPGVVELRCTPDPKIHWQIDRTPSDDHRPRREARQLTVRHEGLTGVGDGHGGAHDGWTNHLQVGDPGARLHQVRVNWLNLPDIHGPIILAVPAPSGRAAWWLGRWRAEIQGWSITLDARPDHAQATSNAREQRLYVQTHTMEIRRTDGSTFTAHRATSLLEYLRVTFSFAFGYWTAPVLPRGYDEAGRIVWEQWYAPICDPYRRIPSAWLYKGRPNDLTELVSCALPVLADPARGSATRLQMLLAVSSVDRGFVEQCILTAAPALENLAWVRLVQRPDSNLRTHRGWSRREYKDRRAAKRLRYLLQEARMSTDIDPVWFPAMARFAAGGDGPDVVTQVRNHLVHPQSPDELDRHPGLVQEVRLLQRRYLTLLVLHDLGYRGNVVDPADRTVMDLDARPVPWLAGSDRPPMPTADRDDP